MAPLWLLGARAIGHVSVPINIQRNCFSMGHVVVPHWQGDDDDNDGEGSCCRCCRVAAAAARTPMGAENTRERTISDLRLCKGGENSLRSYNNLNLMRWLIDLKWDCAATRAHWRSGVNKAYFLFFIYRWVAFGHAAKQYAIYYKLTHTHMFPLSSILNMLSIWYFLYYYSIYNPYLSI